MTFKLCSLYPVFQEKNLKFLSHSDWLNRRAYYAMRAPSSFAHVTIRQVLFIRSMWKLLFCNFSGSWLKSNHNFISMRSKTIADYSNLVHLL